MVLRRRVALSRQWRLEEVARGNSAKDADSNAADNERTKNGLDKDRVLDLAESGLLDPNFAVKHLADDIALLVLGDPGLVLPRVAGSV